MKTFLIALVALIGLTMVDVGTAEAAGGRRRRARVTYYAPAPSATVAQGQAGMGYRTYSYEPTAGYRTYSYEPVALAFRSYSAPRKWSWEYPKTDPRRYTNVR